MATNEDLPKKLQPLKLDIEQVTRTKSILNQNQIQKLWNSTLPRYVYSRPGKGGKNFTYVKTSYVRKVLDSVFGFNWSFDVDTSLAEAFEVAKITKSCVVKATLIGKVKQDGEWLEIKKTQFGRAEVKFKKDSTEPLDFGNDMKAATSDALKKCASLMGVAADVYEPEEFREIVITGSDNDKDKNKLVAKRTAEAKKSLKQQSTKVEGASQENE